MNSTSWSSQKLTYDLPPELKDGQRWSTWSSVEKLSQGPQPRPDWVVTVDGAIDTDLGILKTGKEADVFLVERAVPGDPVQSSVLAAKRYRSVEHRQFQRDDGYREGRKVRGTRERRALAKKSAFGKVVAAGEWAYAEWQALCTIWSAGVPVPYPVQIDGTEILMEFIGVDGAAAPRLAQVRPARALLASYFEQTRVAMSTFARHHVVHGDLSPYNILAQRDRLVIIDLPQLVDLVGNPRGMEYLQRDCHNVCTWFLARGLDVDEHDLFGDLVSEAFG